MLWDLLARGDFLKRNHHYPIDGMYQKNTHKSINFLGFISLFFFYFSERTEELEKHYLLEGE